METLIPNENNNDWPTYTDVHSRTFTDENIAGNDDVLNDDILTEDATSDISQPPKFEFYDTSVKNAFPNKITDYYFQGGEFSGKEVVEGIPKLSESIDLVRSALSFIDKGKPIESDSKIMEFKDLLPGLFSCREISESFGAIINAIQMALMNRKGVPLNRSQLEALDIILTQLLRSPSMPFDHAVDLIIEFEEYDFVVEPAALNAMLELLEPEQE